MIPVTNVHAWVSEAGGNNSRLGTQINTLQELGILEEYIFADKKNGSFVSRPAWNELMSMVRHSDIRVAWTAAAFVSREEAIPDN